LLDGRLDRGEKIWHTMNKQNQVEIKFEDPICMPDNCTSALAPASFQRLKLPALAAACDAAHAPAKKAWAACSTMAWRCQDIRHLTSSVSPHQACQADPSAIPSIEHPR
jgi:hypothetical protein